MDKHVDPLADLWNISRDLPVSDTRSWVNVSTWAPTYHTRQADVVFQQETKIKEALPFILDTRFLKIKN